MYVRMSNPTQLSPDARFMSDGASSRMEEAVFGPERP